MRIRLESFKIAVFRSITDSGWVDVSQFSAILGLNESGSPSHAPAQCVQASGPESA